MIHVDNRAGSGLGKTNNIVPHLERFGLKVSLGRMRFGDIRFEGRGPDERAVSIGIELKEFRNDFLQSIKDGRLVGTQLPGLQRAYEVPMLLMHGQVRRASDGVLETYHPKWGWIKTMRTMMYDDLMRFLFTLDFVYRVRWIITPDLAEAARVVANLHRWWTDKAWEEHGSGRAFDFSADRTLLHQPSFSRTIAKDLPGIGWEKSMTVVRHFRTMYQMALAEEADWRAVPGIGKVIAKKIWRVIHEG